MPDIVVKNQAELLAAIENARGGETIKLLAGNYGTINIGNSDFASTVNIVSADIDNPATIERIMINGSKNIAVKNIELVTPPSTVETDIQLNYVYGSSNISFDGVHVSGPLSNPTQSNAVGLSIKDSSGITIANSTFDHLAAGLNVRGSNNVVIEHNTISDIRSDGMMIASVNNITIDGNLITDMYPAPEDHQDGIQFYTNGTITPSSNITITNNLIIQGEGEAAQGIFMQDEVGGLPFENVSINNNLVYMSGRSNGIFVKGGKNVVVSSNSVLSRSDDSTPIWILVQNVSGGAVSNNVADRLTASANTAVTVGTNSWIEQNGFTLRSLGNINDLAKTKISDLIIDRLGFHPLLGSIVYDLWSAEKALGGKTVTAVGTGDHMVLDLQFAANGLDDLSRFNSITTTAALDLTNIEVANGKGVYHVSTGKGFELSRSNALQLFGMSAFTLSFSMQRDSATSATGQMVGIYQSWAVALQSNGELNFTFRNDAGVTYTIVTNGAKITDTQSHDIAITYDKTAKRAVIYVDNVAKGTGTVTGSTRALEYWSLYVGNPYGTSFAGKVGYIQIRDVALPASQIAQTGSGAGEAPAPGTNPFFLTPSLASAAVTTIADYQRYANQAQLVHA
ncbi:right-handed parallel beta-helix repeat-containing protein [Sphingomonas sp. dw_22]|uniref:right-handed parallel beta-helix repeat-containing protein n=1 Tax=Sphingomonas sp. dw_22 TaxID=2721175 RepID=UPI001BD42847|nr:right-handed parallel beta-helix repeat-containing protein [Sphingomonas sp. dw_22]